VPIYVFLCGSCGLEFEKLFRSVSDDRECPCSECGSKATRQVTSASFNFSHPQSQTRGPLPSNTGTSDDFNFDKTIGRDAESRWKQVEENQALKNSIIRDQRKAGIGITSQHLVKTNDESRYRVMTENERKVINERRELGKVVNDANLENNARKAKSKKGQNS
jgi:putative FmdB family regulatory protein